MIAVVQLCAALDSQAHTRREASSDAGLVARARGGDPSGFDEIVRRHHRRVYDLACRMLGDPEEAGDVTQEAFLTAHQRLAQVREAHSVGAWICRIASNLCMDRLRSPRYRAEVAMAPAEIAATAGAAREQATEESVERIRAAVGRLPPTYRLAVVAYYLEGRSYEEAAEMIGINVRTFKTRLYRARKILLSLVHGSAQEERGNGP